jgi:hypothetical protein
VSAVAVVSAFAFFALPQTPTLVAFQANSPAARVVESGISHLASGDKLGNVIPARYNGQRLSPKVIKAAIRYSSANQLHPPLKGKAVQRKNKIHVIPNRETAPDLARTSFQQQQPAQSFTVLLVVQTSEPGEITTPRWTICIWQFGVTPVQMPAHVQNGTVSKSI